MLRTRIQAGRVAGLVLSLLFATLFLLVHLADVLPDALEVRPGEPAPVTLRLPYRWTPGQTPARGSAEGTWILPRGTVPDPADEPLVRAYEDARRHPMRSGFVLGHFVLYFLLCLFLTTNLRSLGGRGRILRTHVGFLVLLLVFVAGAKALLALTSLPPYLLPVAAVPLWAVEWVHARLALLVNFTLTLLVASLVGFDPTVLGALLATGIGAVATYRDRRRIRALLPAGLWGGATGALVLLALLLAFRGRFDLAGDLARGERSVLLSALGGGLSSGVLAIALGFLGERLLGAVSRSRLLDLTDVERPLLRLMQERAPGSFEHCRAMANLAEIAAAAVRADPLLTRVGAYYHDLGKTVHPKYFVENLEPGEPSPHDAIDPDGSAEVLLSHVIDGTRILREQGIPEPVVEFAYTHHGTSVMEFFWRKCLEQGNPKGLTEEDFRYPGMKPQTKETGILMLVDAVEAASRTIQPPSREGFEEAVYHTIWSKLRQGQLDESGLLLADLRTLAETLVDTLVSASHGRVRYPWQKNGREPTGRTAEQEAR